ncbi:MAG: hypothetical protein ORN83_12895 [Chthoniobacteraceae bacterium]|nr:hypothetical protein [Chthoniobacteraceae bacterium]
MNEELKEQSTLKRDALKRGPRDKWQRVAVKRREKYIPETPKGSKELIDAIRDGYDHFWSIRRTASPY